MDRILQEISAVGRKLEGMDSAKASLTVETKSMRLDIAGFQTQVLGLKQQVATVETRIASWVDRDQELLYLCSKLIDVETIFASSGSRKMLRVRKNTLICGRPCPS
ncbi:hypothetical protein NDU88_001570 [Pleurodeles waltl]|uniref:Uncharacterized protein n=1 Tax=Pleurodeles waltl TaxID=8319 RepID=A0AAV7LGB8_PLEWA|nr:hypothetical protein NDU88_001570 [Pleurodeles waltl]